MTFYIIILLNIVIIFIIYLNKNILINKLVDLSFFTFLVIFCVLFAICCKLLFCNKLFYLSSFFFCYEILTLFFRKLLVHILYANYYRFEFFFLRKFDVYFLIKPNTNVFLFFFILLFFFPTATNIIIFVLIFSDIDLRIFDYDFDEAHFFKNNGNAIYLFPSGFQKLKKYQCFLLSPKNYKYTFNFDFDQQNNFNLIWGIDFKFKKVDDNRMYLCGFH